MCAAGTLTEQGLDLQGIVPIVGGRLHNMVCQMSLLPVSLVELLASCHGLARMGEALVGDPLDQVRTPRAGTTCRIWS